MMTVTEILTKMGTVGMVMEMVAVGMVAMVMVAAMAVVMVGEETEVNNGD
jgi:hypothetical protein